MTTEVGARRLPDTTPSSDELMDRAYAVVTAASPLHLTRSRVEWLVGEHERAKVAIDELLADGFLKELDGGKRLMLGERRKDVELLSAEPSARGSLRTAPLDGHA